MAVVSGDMVVYGSVAAVALVFWLILGHSKWDLWSAPTSRSERESNTTSFAFQVLLDTVISFGSEAHSKIENTKAITLVFWPILSYSKGGL